MSEPKKLIELEQKYQFAIRYSQFLLTLISVYLLGQQVIDNAIYEIGSRIFDIPVTSSTALLCAISLIITASYIAHKKRKSLLVLSLYIGMPIFLWFIGQVLWFSSINTYHCSSIYFTIGAITLARIGYSICKLKKGASPEIERIGLAPDEPLTGENDTDDQLGFNSLADSYTNYILELLYPKEEGKQETPSHVFGVEGGWGSGKTSFLKILKHRIEKEKEVIQVWFSPWMSSSVEILTQDFFNTLAEQIPQLQLRKEIRRYGQALSNIESKGAGKVLNELYPAPSLDAQFKEIEQAIKTHNLKIVVYIDDLDRMDAPEILATFKLIRNTARFSNLVYLVAYDREYIVIQLNKHFKSNKSGENYLEKIIQQSITIPHRTDLLDFIYTELGVGKPNTNGLPTSELNKGINNFRKVKRIVNQVKVLKRKIPDYENNINDLIIFSHIMLNEYQFYQMIKDLYSVPLRYGIDYFRKNKEQDFREELISLLEKTGTKKNIEKWRTLWDGFSKATTTEDIRFYGNLDRFLSND